MARPKLNEAIKAQSKVSRALTKWNELISTTNEDIIAKRLQFATKKSDKITGRPPIPLNEQRERAEDLVKSAYLEYLSIAKENGIIPLSIAEISASAKQTGVGRPASTEVDALNKFIRRMKSKVLVLQQKIDAGIQDSNPTDRKIKSPEDKIKDYNSRIKAAKQEIKQLLMQQTPLQKLYYQINELRISRRQLRLFLKDPTNEQVRNLALTYTAATAQDELDSVNQSISELEEKYDLKLKKKNLKPSDVFSNSSKQEKPDVDNLVVFLPTSRVQSIDMTQPYVDHVLDVSQALAEEDSQLLCSNE